MKIKRFFAPDIRQAIRMVREDQGPDAVILSNKQVDGGVEIVTAIDYDEELLRHADEAEDGRASYYTPVNKPTPRPISKIVWSQDPAMTEMRREMHSMRGLLERQLPGLAWGEMARQHPLRARIVYALKETGLSPALARDIAEQLREDQEYATAWPEALALLAHRIAVTDDDVLDRGGVVSLVGPTGVGKTTTVAKLAARAVLRYGARHVALVTTDNFRIGAHEQLRAFGRILGVPVQTAADGAELRDVLHGLRERRLVLVDTAGMGQRDQRLPQQLALLQASGSSMRNYLVLSATTQLAALTEVANAFNGVSLSGCMLTKLDEATGLGGPLSVVIQQRLPVAYVSDGQRIPEDLRPARAPSLVSQAVALAARTVSMLKKQSLSDHPARTA
jgi:flagellar biosynthesis protein FlhF